MIVFLYIQSFIHLKKTREFNSFCLLSLKVMGIEEKNKQKLLAITIVIVLEKLFFLFVCLSVKKNSFIEFDQNCFFFIEFNRLINQSIILLIMSIDQQLWFDRTIDQLIYQWWSSLSTHTHRGEVFFCFVSESNKNPKFQKSSQHRFMWTSFRYHFSSYS